MDVPNPQQPPTQERRIEQPEESEVNEDSLQSTAIGTVADDKRALDSLIESRTRRVQEIFSALEKRTEENPETSGQQIIDNPAEILDKIRADLSQMEHGDIDDIARVVMTSVLAARDVEFWLAANEMQIQSLVSEIERLEISSGELSNQLAAENKKNLFTKLVRRKKRHAASSQLTEVSGNIVRTDALLADLRSRVGQVDFAIHECSTRSQELAITAAKRLFFSVAEGHQQLKGKLTAVAVKQELNQDLIAKRVLPELDKLEEEGRITKEEAKEYLEILKAQLVEGSQTHWRHSMPQQEVINERNRRLENLKERSRYDFSNIGHRVSSEGSTAADSYYDTIFDFLLREATKERIEQLRDSLGSSLSPVLQEKIAQIAQEIISPYHSWRNSGEERRDVLDLNKMSIDDLKRLDGLERWSLVKNFTESAGIISKKVFARVEEIVIQRLFDEQLFPGRHESGGGTDAAEKMGNLGNPAALPLMLRHIETYGSGHTNNAVVHAMEQLLKESDPVELQRVLESLPINKRKLLETLADENSYMSRLGRINFRYETCLLLQHGDRTMRQEKYTGLLEGAGISKKELQDFYLLLGEREELLKNIKTVAHLAGENPRAVILDYFQELTSHIGPEFPNSLRIIDSLSQELETPRSELLVRCLHQFENPPKNPVLKKIASPEDRDFGAFPLSLAKQLIGVDEICLEKFAQIYQSKLIQSSALEREFFLDGLMLLKGKENGKMVLESLLRAYRGTKDDPKRMRRIFQFLQTLDGFGEYDFLTPDPSTIEGVRQEIDDLQNQCSQTQDQTERKRMQTRIKTLNRDLQNLTGLKGIEEAMKQKVVESAYRQLDLPQEYRDKIEKRLEELLESGLFEIIPALAGQYKEKNEGEIINLLKTITVHIIDGDFTTWRYAHERSEAQLADLTEEQKDFWRRTLEPITMRIELSENEQGRQADELQTVQAMIENAKEHILESQPHFDFSKERAQLLAEKIRVLIEKIKSATSEDEKKRLSLEKRGAQAEATIINGILEIENATPASFTRASILAQARKLRMEIAKLNLPLASLDLEQIEKVFTVGDIKSVTAYESDDPFTLLKVGVEPQETCQSWRKGGANECLLAYVADSNKKVLNVVDGEGKIVARSIIKLTNQKDEDDPELKSKRKTLFVEKPYSLLLNSEVYRAFVRVLLTKAQGLEASITFCKGFDQATLQMFEAEARAFGYEMHEGRMGIFIPQSLNKYEYSDTLGGEISLFDRYQQIEAVTFEKSKTEPEPTLPSGRSRRAGPFRSQPEVDSPLVAT